MEVDGGSIRQGHCGVGNSGVGETCVHVGSPCVGKIAVGRSDKGFNRGAGLVVEGGADGLVVHRGEGDARVVHVHHNGVVSGGGAGTDGGGDLYHIYSSVGEAFHVIAIVGGIGDFVTIH